MYGAQTDFTGYLVVAASQSGRTPEIVRSLQLARVRGGYTIAITNDRESPLALAAELPLHLGVGTERAVPATKTVTAELVAFALIAQAVRDIGFGPQVRDQLSGQVAAVLDDPGPAAEVAAWLAGRTRLAAVARGLLYGAAAEAALKIEETTSLFATAYSAADLRHGPIAIAATGLPVLAFAHPGPAAKYVAELSPRSESPRCGRPARRPGGGFGLAVARRGTGSGGAGARGRAGAAGCPGAGPPARPGPRRAGRPAQGDGDMRR